MLPLIPTPASTQTTIARQAKAARLYHGWSRLELARRSGVSSATIREFERTGRIGLSRLLAIAGCFRSLEPFNALFPIPPAKSLDELEARHAKPKRQRGRTTTPLPYRDGARPMTVAEWELAQDLVKDVEVDIDNDRLPDDFVLP